MQTIDFNKYQVVRMNLNSVAMRNAEGTEILCHRRVFNTIMAHPDFPTFVVEKQIKGCNALWVAVPMTM